MKYDYLIVGAGLFGATLAYKLLRKNKKVIVIDRRSYIGGNVYTEKTNDIIVHCHGPHIFHTNNEKVWKFVTQLTKFNNFINTPKACFQGKYYSLPFNMNTFNELWNINEAKEAKNIIYQQRKETSDNANNLEDKAISLVGLEIYEKFIKGYTQKQWGRKCKDLPPSIIERIPLRFCFNNNYYDSRYQGIPIKGYTDIVNNLLLGIEVRLSEDFTKSREYYKNISNKIIYSGSIDEYYEYCFGNLEYRTCRFKNEYLEVNNYQNNAIINYTDLSVPWTRIIEHKWFNFGLDELNNEISNTIITKEYSKEWEFGDEPYYPINNNKNNELYTKYKDLSLNDSKVLFVGRLGDYKYYDMDQVIEKALELSEKLN